MTLKIGTARKAITPEIGTLLAGYDANVVSDGIRDDLYISGIAFDDGMKRALLLSYDLLGLDEDIVNEIRKKCAAANGLEAGDIILTCTHTHSGPHTRRNLLADLDKDYVAKVINWSIEAASDAFKCMLEVDLFHYSVQCHENINRRVILPDNSCKNLPSFKHLEPLANNITDPELGILYFVDKTKKTPVATLVNYAAHPLACQTGGASGRKISSDYPGVLRKYVESELGGFCSFTSGACGDLHPRRFENGFARTDEIGTTIGRITTEHFFDAARNQEMFKTNKADIKTHSSFVKVPFRDNEEKSKLYGDQKSIRLELQFLAIGDICFVGVPGELLVEPGLEIKWNSPFRKTFILYNSTAYISYISHANAYLEGGYETDTALLASTASFTIVSAAIDALNQMFNTP